MEFENSLKWQRISKNMKNMLINVNAMDMCRKVWYIKYILVRPVDQQKYL
ncbi:Conserved hypothetical protein [Clostridium acetobutylicum EA 2018]|uniref:Uncharacterized protein n=1 Tax=Clostridium acetobutylicum (strain ATCC 824 / DSM 792 / JCM 1419 / IAM 19013 / LMG 5710 / NBRC 13948 / NRRL B-527 / VKM B-1787 / 2291 / W) TaxID=272562 RepID=Q97G27_CLOAB|nr:Hypothetical protein CA_C2545 [Clostridium acetobutylicum ATCC 824]ADZ21595.1 Conserved hypothetical protein [Clostridium acetobutylicum EA 2018]AEI32421.1 hypothetical protein SMB_G2580 [Clostridium acetobutylicum DSM 1731]AWV79086.1 hypothetical protein DK921_03030 [Clostridium acetobutylicum]PSM07046.1 hypothetical protein C7T89_03030 [Clostridium sp. NJ4]